MKRKNVVFITEDFSQNTKCIKFNIIFISMNQQFTKEKIVGSLFNFYLFEYISLFLCCCCHFYKDVRCAHDFIIIVFILFLYFVCKKWEIKRWKASSSASYMNAERETRNWLLMHRTYELASLCDTTHARPMTCFGLS